ncbi:hypothetical protein MKW92_014326, partial [Papaver armeniacum]
MQSLMKSHNEHSLPVKVIGGHNDFAQLKMALSGRLFPIQIHHIETRSSLNIIQMSLEHQNDKEFILANQPWVAGQHV